MRILFLGRHYTYFRNFDSVLRELGRRGHTVHLAVERDESFGGLALVQRLADEYPGITYGEGPVRDGDDDWGWAASRLRLGLDYLRYQHRLFDSAPKLRDRARERTPGGFVRLGDVVRRLGEWARRLATGIVRRIERAIPEDPAIGAFIAHHRPDAVLLTPLIDLGSSQIDYLRAARAQALPTALCVWSWDHLSSKALIREWPDRVFVWNDTQKHEAVTLHGVAPERVVVTGAQCFDQWFDRMPSRSRDAFCAHVGLPAERPFLLWVCSALFLGSPVEAEFVVEWLTRLRASGHPRLRDVSVLVRPHPSRLSEWDGVDLSPFGPVVLYGGNPVDAEARADYFDSLHHSVAVAGLNTSAFIEAGIVGRSVHTILLPQFEENQTGTVHFHYLLEAGGGLLEAARDFDTHFAQLDAAVQQPRTTPKPFVRAFVRPRGLDVAATPVFVEQVEHLGGLRVSAPRPDPLLGLWRNLLGRLIALRHDVTREPLLYSERELGRIHRLRTAAEAKARARSAERKARLEERRAFEAARAVERAAERETRREARRLEKQALKHGAGAGASSAASSTASPAATPVAPPSASRVASRADGVADAVREPGAEPVPAAGGEPGRPR